MEKVKLGTLAASVLLIGSSCTSQKEGKQSMENVMKTRPNIIYILADDLGYAELGCYGQEKIRTPNIDRMAEQGMKFTQHYSGSTVSAPSRSVLMTGQHTGHTLIRGNKPHGQEGQYPLADSIRTVAEVLQDAAYVTGAFGKWGLGYPGSEGDPVNQGFDEFFGYNCQKYAHRYYPPHLWHNKEKVILHKNTGGKKGTYASDLIHEKAMEFIDANADTSFFAFLPYIIPHAELTVPHDSIYDMYHGKFPETPYEGRSGNNPGEAAAYGPDMWIPGYCPQESPNAVVAAMITRLDRYVGEIESILKEKGISDNTLIIFTSDNGPCNAGGRDADFFDANGPLRGMKRDLYEGGIRVPMIAKWPGKIEAGSVSDHISAFWDVLPTFADLAGGKTPQGIDGISFLPTLLQKGKQNKHTYMYWEFEGRGGKQAVRMGKWKGVRNDLEKNPDAPVELYNLEKDIEEDNNVAAEHPKITNQIRKAMYSSRNESTIFPLFKDD